MNADPPIKLSELRDIGWKEWDPIGLLPAGEVWDHKPFADEYDGYLRKVAGDFRRGGSVDEAIRYLLDCEREHMGLGVRPGQETRAKVTALSIQRYMAELDGIDPASA